MHHCALRSVTVQCVEQVVLSRPNLVAQAAMVTYFFRIVWLLCGQAYVNSCIRGHQMPRFLSQTLTEGMAYLTMCYT